MPRLFLIILLCAAWTAAASPGEVHEFKLDNGLKLIVKEDHRAPVVVSQVWYKVGSSYEHSGVTGLSHVLEHMMFKGTRKHGPNEASRIISANGGRENAFTGRDYTAYYQQLEKSRLPVSFELESDRMRNLLLKQEEFVKEVQVVMEERRLRTDDDPESLTYEHFAATAFHNGPYQNPVIGWMDDLENMTLDDLKQWYKTWYAPNNATVVVVGDVQPEEVFALAKKYFGPLKPSKLMPLKPRREVEQKGLRRAIVKAPAELPYLIMGYQTPSLTAAQDTDWEPYALEVLSGILSGGNSARLAKHLVREERIAASAGAGYNLYSRVPDLFTIEGTPAQGRSVAELEQALRDQIKRLQDEPVSEAELARIKAQVVAGKVYEQDSTFGQAMQIGTLVTVGLDWRLQDSYLDRINAVTAQQIQQVARNYLNDDRLTVAVLEPLPLDPNKKPRGPSDGHLGGGNVR
ncbi:MAG: insulinase family protein [Gammaproteobacteria bacterium]|nr:insulinase family protein [Gammaproteobacteria bacterium]